MESPNPNFRQVGAFLDTDLRKTTEFPQAMLDAARAMLPLSRGE